jgi:hypothetical protein
MLNNKGQMRTIEAFLSILLLFSTLALATLISPATNMNNDNALATIGMQALVSMDIDGRLGRLIDEGNWTTMASALDTLLPIGISYNLSVYDEEMQPINNVSISNGVIPDRNVVSVQYPCVSPSSQGNCYLLRLQLATAR